MSTGDWFTLRPLNVISKQEIENDLHDNQVSVGYIRG
jgi:hypothetical protein